MLGLSSLVVISMGSAATATYAWFMTARTATVDLTNAIIRNDEGNLRIEYTAMNDKLDASHLAVKDNTSYKVNPTDSTKKITAVNELTLAANTTASVTDVSGDGKKFYKPEWNSEASSTNLAADLIRQVINGYDLRASDSNFADIEAVGATPKYTAVDGSTTYYVRFGLKLYNTGNTDFYVYLNGASDTATGCSVSGSPVTAVPDLANGASAAEIEAHTKAMAARDLQVKRNAAAAKSARIAIWDKDDYDNATDEKTPLVLWQPTAEADTTKYPYQNLSVGASTDKIYGVKGYTATTYAYDGNSLATTTTQPSYFHVGDYAHIDNNKDKKAGQQIIEVSANSNKDVVVAMWVEGTSSYTYDNYDGIGSFGDTIVGGKFDVALRLSAIYTNHDSLV